MATGGPRSFTSTPLRLRDGHCVSESGDTLLLVHRTSSRSGRCSGMARTGGHATVTCAVGWRCVGSEHRVPRRPSIRPRGCLNVLSRSHPRYSWNCKLCAISCFGTSLGRGLHCKTCHGSRSLRSLSFCALRDIAPSTMHSRDRPQHSHPHLLTLDRLLVTRAFKQRSNSVQTVVRP